MEKPSTSTALWRGFRRKCPNCGEGKLFRGYLRVEPTCADCGHDNGRYPADDAPPYFTILIVGHLVIAPMLFLPFIWRWNPFLVVGITLPPLAVLTLALLPLIKGAAVGLMYSVGLTRRDAEPVEPGL